MRILMLALLLAACAPPSADQAERDARNSRPLAGPTVSIGGGLGTYYGAGSR